LPLAGLPRAPALPAAMRCRATHPRGPQHMPQKHCLVRGWWPQASTRRPPQPQNCPGPTTHGPCRWCAPAVPCPPPTPPRRAAPRRAPLPHQVRGQARAVWRAARGAGVPPPRHHNIAGASGAGRRPMTPPRLGASGGRRRGREPQRAARVLWPPLAARRLCKAICAGRATHLIHSAGSSTPVSRFRDKLLLKKARSCVKHWTDDRVTNVIGRGMAARRAGGRTRGAPPRPQAAAQAVPVPTDPPRRGASPGGGGSTGALRAGPGRTQRQRWLDRRGRAAVAAARLSRRPERRYARRKGG
jgi:hypothetical protein